MERTCVEWRLPNLLQNLSPAWQGILAEGWGFPLVQLPSQCLNLVCSLPARSSSHSLNTSSDVKLIFFLVGFSTVDYTLSPGQLQDPDPHPAARDRGLKPQM